MGSGQEDRIAEATWGDLLEEIIEGLSIEEEEGEYFEYAGISNRENMAIEESLIWGDDVTGVAVYCMAGANREWYVHVDPTQAEGMDKYGKLGRGLLGKFREFKRASDAVKFITGKVYAQEEEGVANSDSDFEQAEQETGAETPEEEKPEDISLGPNS